MYNSSWIPFVIPCVLFNYSLEKHCEKVLILETYLYILLFVGQYIQFLIFPSNVNPITMKGHVLYLLQTLVQIEKVQRTTHNLEVLTYDR